MRAADFTGLVQYLNKMRTAGLSTAADLRAKRDQLQSFGVKVRSAGHARAGFACPHPRLTARAPTLWPLPCCMCPSPPTCQALGHRSVITGMLDGDPAVRSSFALLTTKEDAVRALKTAVNDVCGGKAGPTADAIARFSAGVPLPVCDGSTVSGRAVSFAMASAHCQR